MPDPDLSVFMTDLLNAAGAFQYQSGVLSNIMHSGGPTVPDGGDAEIDSAMRQAAQLLAELHSQLATVISHHGTDLKNAHTTYDKADTNLADLATEIVNPDAI